MRCILHGHRPVIEEGKSKVGWVRWCPDCGTVFERGGEPEPATMMQVQQAKERPRVPVQ